MFIHFIINNSCNSSLTVFTSSVNVCFNGQPISNGNEDDHKWIECKCSADKTQKQRKCQNHHLDAYSKSKQEAEKIIMSTTTLQSTQDLPHSIDCLQSQSGNRGELRTCVLRYLRPTIKIQYLFI